MHHYVLKSTMLGDPFITFDKEWFWSSKNPIKGKNPCQSFGALCDFKLTLARD